MTALYSEIEKSSIGRSEEHLIEVAAVITHFLDDANAPVRAKTIRPMLVKGRFSVDTVVDKMLALYRSK